MNISYVIYDNAGVLTGAFLQAIQPEHEAAHIIVTDAERLAWVNYRANEARDGVELAPVVTPQPVIPQSVTMRQARLALLQAGQLAAVSSAIAGMTGVAGDKARIEWEFSSEVLRGQTLVGSMAAVLGMTSAQTDAMFVTAASL